MHVLSIEDVFFLFSLYIRQWICWEICFHQNTDPEIFICREFTSINQNDIINLVFIGLDSDGANSKITLPK